MKEGAFGLDGEDLSAGAKRDEETPKRSGLAAEVTLAWGNGDERVILGVKTARAGQTITVGEGADCDFVLPVDSVGATGERLLSFDGREVRVRRLPRSSLIVEGELRSEEEVVLREGQRARVLCQDFSLRVSVVRVEDVARTSPFAVLQSPASGSLSVSALLHGLVFGACALFLPALAETDAEAMGRDHLLFMQRMLTAAAERERDAPPPEPSPAAVDGAAETSPAQGSSGGARAAGAGGAMGRTSERGQGHWSASGRARPEEATLPRTQALLEAEAFGMVNVLSGDTTDLRAPLVPWGSALNGSDERSHFGNFWSLSLGDAFGTGLGLSGTGEGGDGKYEGVGVTDLGGLGKSLDGRAGAAPPGGIGGCLAGRPCGQGPLGGHEARLRMRLEGKIETNGRIPPDVIQRIVRQNQGRFRACYEAGLRDNPRLEGRVAVRFVIDRTGGVAVANDGGSDLPDAIVRACVVRSFHSLSFPEPQGGTVTVTYPIRFTPE